jgi:1-acyl-sn-glycerol-3-phosphate acyltransferase
LRHAQKLLERGEALVVFPEGACSPSGEMQEVLPGAVLVAQRGNLPIVPVGIWGTQHVTPYGKVLPKPTTQRVHIHFGAPLRFDDLKTLPKREARAMATQRLEDAIRAAREVAKNGGA